MDRFKWLFLALGMVTMASVGLVACGDDDPIGCESASDCGDGETCFEGTCAETCTDFNDCSNPGHACSTSCADVDLAQGICFQPCEFDEDCGETGICDTSFCGGEGMCVAGDGGGGGGCFENDDCSDGLVCNVMNGQCVAPGGVCSNDDDCGSGESCNQSTGVCEAGGACTEDSECYDLGNAYCGEGDAGNECVDTSCGVPFNSCARCTTGPNNGSRAEDAPVIFAAESGACRIDDSVCADDAPLFCEWSFFFFDPNGDFTPRGGANSNVFVVSSGGAHNPTFSASQTGEGIGRYGACFPDAQTPSTAIFVRDAAGNASNTLCTITSR